MTPRFTRNVAALPDHGFGPRQLTWFGVTGFMLIEGTGFALAFASYFFLMAQEQQWPASAYPPDLGWASATTMLLILSEIPNFWVSRVAKREDLRKTQTGLIVMGLVVLPIFVTRGFEFDHLNVGWDRSAYGSIVWAILVMHTTHLITDWVDSVVLGVLMHTSQGKKGKSFVDTAENALYWHFIVISWVLCYILIYWVPRLA